MTATQKAFAGAISAGLLTVCASLFAGSALAAKYENGVRLGLEPTKAQAAFLAEQKQAERNVSSRQVRAVGFSFKFRKDRQSYQRHETTKPYIAVPELSLR